MGRTYSTLKFKGIDSSELDEFSTRVISLYTEDFTRVMDANTTHGHTTIC
jgi:hypothetical protein